MSTFVGKNLTIVSAGGLTPSTSYQLAYDDGLPLTGGNPTYNSGNDVSFTSGQLSNASGDWAITMTEALAFSHDHIWLHPTTGVSPLSVANRIEGFPNLTDALVWSGTGAAVPFGTAAVLDSATPGNTTVDLSWTAAFGCDARLTGITYQVSRATNSAFTTGVSNVGTPTSATTIQDTGRTNGTTYWYRVVATLTYTFGTITHTELMPASNILSATPTASVEVWGSIPQ